MNSTEQDQYLLEGLAKENKKAIEYIYSKIDVNNTTFYIVSDDAINARKQEFLSLLPLSNLIFVDNKEYDEIKTLELVSAYIFEPLTNTLSTFASRSNFQLLPLSVLTLNPPLNNPKAT